MMRAGLPRSERPVRGWNVLGLGAVAVDDLLYVDGYPGPDTKVCIAGERREGGGLVATALVTVARLGGRAAFLSVLGDDELSAFAIAGLVRAGVDCSRVVSRAGARPIHSRIIVDQRSGDRTILYSIAGVTSLTASEVDPADVAAADVLLVDSTVAPVALEVVRLAHDLGIPVVADIEDADGQAVSELVLSVDHLVVGRQFALKRTGERSATAAVRALWRDGMAACIVTSGPEGCWFLTPETGGDVRHEPAIPVHAVDTNGCGDVFHGAYAARIAAKDGVATAVTVATRMAAAKASRGAGWDGIPAWSEVADRPLDRSDGGRRSRPDPDLKAAAPRSAGTDR